MKELIFRCDDVSANTDFSKLYRIYFAIKENFPEAKIISAVSLFSKKSKAESIYPETPFRRKPVEYLYDIDAFLKSIPLFILDNEIASHGLIHLDHGDLSYEMQELSIVVSCNYLQTKMFAAPFNTYNKDTIKICVANDIELLDQREWKSMEFNEFNTKFPRWSFHAWNYTADIFNSVLKKGE